MKKLLFFIANILIINTLSFGQSVTIVPSDPANPTKGTMDYNNATNQLQYWNSAAWIPITNAASGTGWALSGNHIYSGNSGNVGIGTTTPLYKLSVVSTTNAYGLTHSDGNITMGSWLTATTGQFGTKSNHPLEFFTNNGSAQMTILQNGNVGIGTINPTLYKFDIVHSNVGLRVKSTTGNSQIDIDASNGDAILRFFKNGVGKWQISNNAVTDNFEIYDLNGGGRKFYIESSTGNVNIKNDLTVNSGKGIVRSNDGTQLKTILFQTPNNIILTNFMNGSVGIVPMVFSAFSAPPTISVGNTEGILNADNLLITVTNVTNSSATMVVRHVGTQVVASTNGIVHAIIIGPQ